ncbi:MAG: Ig-like domain-containing protein [Spirochaetia bacterium]|nr:Ig-like domain-containing protein [Spirochaetia bacterium]
MKTQILKKIYVLPIIAALLFTMTNCNSNTFDILSPEGTVQPGNVSTETSITNIACGAPCSATMTGQTITIQVVFSDTVTVDDVGGTAIPTITLTDGTNTYTATYTAGSGTNTIEFTYTIGASDNISSLSPTDILLNGGTITDPSGQSVNLTIPATNDLSSLAFSVDGVAPTLTNVTIASSTGTAYAKEGDTVTISLTASETISSPTVTIAGQAATISGGGSSYTAEYVMTIAEAEGVIPFAVDFADTAGNAGVQVTATTDSSSITYDKIMPVLNTVNISSNNTNDTSLAKTGEIVTIDIIANETILQPTVTIAGQTATISGGGASFTATYTMAGGETEGAIPFTINFSDPAGNAGTEVTATTDSSSVTFDKTPPLFTSLLGANEAVDNVINNSEKTSGLAIVALNASNYATAEYTNILNDIIPVTCSLQTFPNSAIPLINSLLVDGTFAVCVKLTDGAGNITYGKSPQIIRSITGPVFTSLVGANEASDTYINATEAASTAFIATLTASGNDHATEPQLFTTILNDSTPVTCDVGQTYGNTTIPTIDTIPAVDGVYAICVQLKDSANNLTYGKSVQFIRDTVLPTLTSVTIQSNNANSSLAKTGDTITLNFTTSEVLTSTPIVTIAGQPADSITGTGPYTATYTLTGSETQGLVAFSINTFSDLAGNAGSAVTATTNSSSVTYDKTLPTLSTVIIASNNATTNLAKTGNTVTINITASETLLAAPTVTISGAGATVTGTGPYTATYTMFGTETEGVIPFAINFSDSAGNAGIVVTATTNASSVTFDKTAPLFTSLIGANEAIDNIVNGAETGSTNPIVALTATDFTVDDYTAILDDSTPITCNSGQAYLNASVPAINTMPAIDGVYAVCVRLSDAAGNIAYGKSVQIVRGTSGPVFGSLLGANEAVDGYINATETGSTLVIATLIASGNDHATTPEMFTNLLDDSTPVTCDAGQTYGNSTVPTIDTMPAVDGVYAVCVKLMDSLSNITYGKSVQFIRDIAAPVAPTSLDLAAASDSGVSNTDNITKLTAVTINGLSEANAIVEISSDQDGSVGLATADALGQWSKAVTLSSATSPLTHLITATATDPAGNTSTASTSLSIELHTVAPVLTTATISSNNANSTLAKTADTITLIITANMPLSAAPTVTFAGQPADSVTGSGAGPYTATYTLTGSESESIIGFTIDFVCLAGNAGTQVTATTNSSIVTYDKTLPTLSSVTIASNNPVPNYAKTGNTISLNITASEPLITAPTVSIAGGSAVVSGTGPYTATYTMLVGDTEGIVPFTIDFIDTASNAGTQVNATTNASSVTFDKTQPSVAVNQNAGQADPASTLPSALAPIVFDVVFSEAIDATTFATTDITHSGTATGVVWEIVNSGNNKNFTLKATAADGDGTFIPSIAVGLVKDIAGNTNIASTSTDNSVTLSTTALTVTVNRAGYPTPTQTNLTNTLPIQFDVKFSEAIDGGSFTALDVSQNAGATSSGITWNIIHVSGNTDYTLQATAITNDGTVIPVILAGGITAGVKSNEASSSTDSTVTYDNTAPTLTTVSISSNNADTTLAKTGNLISLDITASEALSAAPTVTIAGNSASVSGTGPYTATYTLAGTETEGALAFTIDFIDAVGNAGTQVTATTDSSSVTYDKTLPTLSTVSIISNNANTAYAKTGDTITLSITASESLLAAPTVNIAGGSASVSGSGPYSATYTMTGAETSGLVAFTVNFTDLSGNAGTQVTSVTDASNVTYDKTPPSITTFAGANEASDNVVTNAEATSILAVASMGATDATALTYLYSNILDDSTPVTCSAQSFPNSSIPAINTMPGTYTVYALCAKVTDAAGNISYGKTPQISRQAAATFAIASAQTLDCDPVNGVLDHYKITFTGNVTDSDFDGYLLNNEGAVTVKWVVAGHGGVRMDHGTGLNAICGSDTANDSVVYIKFTENSSVNTGVKPELTADFATITSPDYANETLYSNTGNVLISDVTETDGAGPYIWYAMATHVGGADGSAGTGDTLEIRYSESTNAPSLAGLDLDNEFLINQAAGNYFGVNTDITSAVWGTTTYTNDTVTLTFATNNPTVNEANLIEAADTGTVQDLIGNNSPLVANVLSPPAIAGTFSALKLGPVITSAEYYDIDNNGYIEHVKITFNKAVNDTKFPGYVGNNQINNITLNWKVAGYNNVALDTRDTVNAVTLDNVTNDNVLWLIFSEGADYDTGAKPDLTALSGLTQQIEDVEFGCALNTIGNTSNCGAIATSVLNTTHVSEKDMAAPIFTSATARGGDNFIFLWYSENVWSNPGMPACGSGGALEAADFAYNEVNIGGATSITGTSPIDNCASTDAFVRVLTDVAFVTNDLGADQIAAAANQIYDAADNAMVSGVNMTIQGTIAPYVMTASSYYDTVALKYWLRIVFSEPMNAASATLPANYALSIDTVGSCASIVANPTSIKAVTTSVFDLETDAQCGDTVYKITASTNILDGNEIEPVGSPNEATTVGTDLVDVTRPKLLQALSLSTTTVQLTYSEPMKTGDAVGSAECDTTYITGATCNTTDVDGTVTGLDHLYLTTPVLGDVFSVIATADPSVYILTHADPQHGSFYAIRAYADNAVSYIPEDLAGNDLSRNPENQATFQGSGTIIANLEDGQLFTDPFADGTSFSFAFNYQNRIYLGPNDYNTGAFRFEADGRNPVTVTFLANGACASGTFGVTGGGTCGVDLGPAGEEGIVGFNSSSVNINATDYEILMVGPIKPGVSNVYFTQDIDTLLDWNACGITGTVGANSESIQLTYAFGSNMYMAVAQDQGTAEPVMNRIPLTEAGGIISCGTASDLGLKNLASIGSKAGNPAISKSVIGIDSILYVPASSTVTPTDTLYIANNGGMAASAGTPLVLADFTTFLTQTNLGGVTLVLPTAANGGLQKLRPGQKGVPIITEWKGALYMARNLAVSQASFAEQSTNNGAELWKCTAACTTGANWYKVASSANFDGAGNNLAISLLQANGDALYIGFDNVTDGIAIFRTNDLITEIDGDNSGDGHLDFTLQGTLGLSEPTVFKYIFSASSLSKQGQNYIYITVGNGSTDPATKAIRVVRQID